MPTDKRRDRPEPFDQTRFPDVLAGVRAGDDRAIEWLFTKLQPALLRYLRAQQSDLADDVAAEVWLSVAKTLSQFSGDWAEFRAFFFTIARRRLADHRRNAARDHTNVAEPAALERWQAPDATDREAFAHLSGQQAAMLITSVLSGDQAEVLLLRVLADLDTNQVATIMQRSPTWVRVTQHRAVRTLAKRLGPKLAVML